MLFRSYHCNEPGHTSNNYPKRDHKRRGVNLVENEGVVGEEEEMECVQEEDPYDGAKFTVEEGKRVAYVV